MIKQDFTSLYDLYEWLKASKPAEGCLNESENMLADHDWDLNTDYAAAMKMAADGGYWEEGAKDLMEAHVETTNALQKQITEQEYDVTGHTLDMDEYLSGSPECWINGGEEEEAPVKVITMGIANDMLCDVSSKSVLYQGAAALSLIDKLESEGNRVELYACWGQRKSGKARSAFSVKIKSAEDHWSPASVAFALCHTAFSRRLMFAVCERFVELADVTLGGYGTLLKTDDVDDFDVYIPGMADNLRSGKQAMKAMTEQYNTQIETMENAA